MVLVAGDLKPIAYLSAGIELDGLFLGASFVHVIGWGSVVVGEQGLPGDSFPCLVRDGLVVIVIIPLLLLTAWLSLAQAAI